MAKTIVTVQIGNKKARVRRALFDSEGHVALREFLLADGSWAMYHNEFPENSELDMEERKVKGEPVIIEIKDEYAFQPGASDVEKLKEKGIAGTFRESAKYLCLYFMADEFSRTEFMCPAEKFQLGHGVLVFISDEPKKPSEDTDYRIGADKAAEEGSTLERLAALP